MVARSSPPRKATPGPRAPGIRGTLRRARRCRVGAALRLPPGPAGRNREERPSPGRSPPGPPQPWSPKPPPLGKDERQTGGAQGPGRRAGVWHWESQDAAKTKMEQEGCSPPPMAGARRSPAGEAARAPVSEEGALIGGSGRAAGRMQGQEWEHSVGAGE